MKNWEEKILIYFFLEYPGYGENRFFLNKETQKLSDKQKRPHLLLKLFLIYLYF